MSIHRKPLIDVLGPVVVGQEVTLRVDLLPDPEAGDAECGWDTLEIEVDLACASIEWPGGAAAANGFIAIHSDGGSRPFEVTGRVAQREQPEVHVVAAFTYKSRHSGIARRTFPTHPDRRESHALHPRA